MRRLSIKSAIIVSVWSIVTMFWLVYWISLASAQVPMTGAGLGAPGGAAFNCSGDTDYAAWATAVGSIGTTQGTATCNLITSLKAHSLWTGTDRLWLYASENATQASVDLKARATHTVVPTMTFVASQGYTGDAATGYIDTGFKTGTYSQNSGSITAYLRNSRTVDQAWWAIGNDDASVISGLDPLQGGVFDWAVNDSSAAVNQINNTQVRGCWTATRTGSSAIALYTNSNSTPVKTDTYSSGTPPNLNFFVGALNLSGSAVAFSGDQIAIVHIGGGLTGANAAQLQTDLNAYMTTLGTNVSGCT